MKNFFLNLGFDSAYFSLIETKNKDLIIFFRENKNNKEKIRKIKIINYDEFILTDEIIDLYCANHNFYAFNGKNKDIYFLGGQPQSQSIKLEEEFINIFCEYLRKIYI